MRRKPMATSPVAPSATERARTHRRPTTTNMARNGHASSTLPYSMTTPKTRKRHSGTPRKIMTSVPENEAVNPFKLKQRDNFPPIEHAWHTDDNDAVNVSTDDTSHASALSEVDASLDLSIGARAALYEHMRHVERYGIDGECVPALEAERNLNEARHPLDEQWENLLDGKNPFSVTDTSSCMSPLTVGGMSRSNANLDSSVLTEDSEDFFNSSRVMLLRTPEHNQRQRIEMVGCRGDDDSDDEVDAGEMYDVFAAYAMDDTDPSREEDSCESNVTPKGHFKRNAAPYHDTEDNGIDNDSLPHYDDGRVYPDSPSSFGLPPQGTPGKGFVSILPAEENDISQIDVSLNTSDVRSTPKHSLAMSVTEQPTLKKPRAVYSLTGAESVHDVTDYKMSSSTSFGSTPHRSPLAPIINTVKANRLLASPRKTVLRRQLREKRSVLRASRPIQLISSPNVSPIVKRAGKPGADGGGGRRTSCAVMSTKFGSDGLHGRSGQNLEASIGSTVSIFDAFAIDFLRAIESSRITSPKLCNTNASSVSRVDRSRSTRAAYAPAATVPSSVNTLGRAPGPGDRNADYEAVRSTEDTPDRQDVCSDIRMHLFSDASPCHLAVDDDSFSASTRSRTERLDTVPTSALVDDHLPKSLFSSFEAVAGQD